MPGNKSRTKGLRFEQWVARKIREVCDYPVRRCRQAWAHDDEPDVMVGNFMAVECKIRKRITMGIISDGMEQLAHLSGRGIYRIVVTKSDRQEPMVHMSFDDLLHLIEEFQNKDEMIGRM